MRKFEDEKPDGIEIISIGKIYTGPWEKKYWSSSRGKDRYPYLVGYTSVRTQNGFIYKMEILEGHKGPSFKISSPDGQSCSGDTPDIAWEIFQKKGCSGIKLRPGKRFSCKIDGVELFGFKNTFVQRLLRESAFSVCGTDHSILTSTFSSIASDTVKFQSEESNPDVLPYLEKTQVARKRSRNTKLGNSKRLHESRSKQHQQEKCTRNTGASNSKEIDQSKHGFSSISSTLGLENEVSGLCSPGVLGTGKRKLQLDPIDTSDHLKVGGAFPQQEKELTKSGRPTGLDAEDFPQNKEPNDKSEIIEVSMAEEKDEVMNDQHGMPIFSDTDLCAPDTLDCSGDSICASSLNNHVQAMVNDVSKPEILVTDSHPEDERGTLAFNTLSENCDTESVGQEIAKSMMTVLLPKALPLLQTFVRKKKKKTKPLQISLHRSQEENNMSNAGVGDAFIANKLPKHSELQRQRQRQKDSVPFTCHDSGVSTSGNTESMVPDSFDYDDLQNLIPGIAKADYVSHNQEDRAQLPVNNNGEATSMLRLNGIREHELNFECETQTALSEKPHKDTTLTPEKEPTASSKGAEGNCQSTDELPTKPSTVRCPPNIPASMVKCSPRSNSIICGSFTDVGLHEKSEGTFAYNKLPKDGDMSEFDISSSILQSKTTICCRNASVDRAKNVISRLNIQQNSKLNSKLHGLELFASYVLPMPISMVQLLVKENNLYICVKCGALDHKESTIFVYKALRKGDSMGGPSLIGHVRIGLPSSKSALGGDIASDSSLLQFTPDAQFLVLINSIKTPYCREGKLHCLCSACTSDCFKNNAVKIVQLNSGYVSLVTKLETTQDVRCFLVCEPSFLLAAEESGKLKLWVMNSRWSAHKENWCLPTFDCMLPCLVELKRVPKSAVLVVGHNGFGDFGLWDIEKRSLMSTFSSPGMLVSQCIPTSALRWQKKGEHKTKELIDEIMDATKKWFTGKSENHFPPEDKDVAVWLLISTLSDPDAQCYQSSEKQSSLVECWRLALLVNDIVIIGSVFDPGAAAVTSAGVGLIGTSDGLVYMWELSTGMKLGKLHSFEGTKVSCITTDTTNSDALAIASGSQLLVYLPS
ncbi:hypothetical protein ACJIZ3_020276 [Penstemon smallii]|uniref:FYR C-terminal domain-containing protein n=1 Tax=Penstemon smallii TaxID=265156 RepID=A0ABD3SIE4_9LAMI